MFSAQTSPCYVWLEFKAACATLVDLKHVLIDFTTDGMSRNCAPGKSDYRTTDRAGGRHR